MTQIITIADGRQLVVHELPFDGSPAATLLWHHGSPQTGAILDPIVEAATAHRLRVISVARPGYGGSTRLPGRSVGAVAEDLASVADELRLDRLIAAGASGGGPHALACAMAMPERVASVVVFAGLAPFSTSFDWFAGMADPSGLHAAERGLTARQAHALVEEFDPASFVTADYIALEESWSSLGSDVDASQQWGDVGLVDDDVAFVSPWGFEPTDVRAPTLIVHGSLDRVVPVSHGRRLHSLIAGSVLDERPDDGHISVLNSFSAALAWALTV